MRTRQRLWAIPASVFVFILSGSFPAFAAEADQTTEEIILSEAAAEAETEAETDQPVPEEAPAFDAHIAFQMGSYTVIGTFTDLTPDITQIDILCSPDGENWQNSIMHWNLSNLGTDDEDKLKTLQNQPCLAETYEPMKSYMAGTIDRFYLKLRITRENGLSYETRSAVIERGGLQPIPEGTECRALFSSAIAVREPDPSAPYRHRKYGRYELTVSANATAEDIAALLPETLPVEIQLTHNPDFTAIGTVNCPVTWKPLSLPQLTAGESITIPDAAEEIMVPDGTLVSTPIGVFQLNEPLSLNIPPSTDEVRLVLNVSQEDREPTGVLRENRDGLEAAFYHKPTGATSIRAYILTEGESKWTELSGLSLLEEFNRPSTASGGYALILRNDQEPFRSYRAAIDSGETPTPFFIGLKIEGGIYDGKQLILAWPDIYEQLPDLPELGGAGGNEGNAGADDEDDSTEGGQRPDLPQPPDGNQEEQPPVTNPDDKHEEQPPVVNPDDKHEEQPPVVNPDDKHEEQPPVANPDSNRKKKRTNPDTAPDNSGQRQQYTPETVFAAPEIQSILFTDEPISGHPSDLLVNPLLLGQRPNLPQTTSDIAASNEENSSKPVYPAEQQAAGINEEEIIPASSDAETVMEQAIVMERKNKKEGRIPFLPVTTAIAAGGCIGAAVYITRGNKLFYRIAGKIKKSLHKLQL